MSWNSGQLYRSSLPAGDREWIVTTHTDLESVVAPAGPPPMKAGCPASVPGASAWEQLVGPGSRAELQLKGARIATKKTKLGIATAGYDTLILTDHIKANQKILWTSSWASGLDHGPAGMPETLGSPIRAGLTTGSCSP